MSSSFSRKSKSSCFDVDMVSLESVEQVQVVVVPLLLRRHRRRLRRQISRPQPSVRSDAHYQLLTLRSRL